MAIFDAIVAEAAQRFGLGREAAGGLLAALLRLISDPATDGFTGFIDRFKRVGLGSTIDSWITTGDNTPLSNEQLESAVGEETIASIAADTGVDRSTATSALAGMIPSVVDTLTANGTVPDDSSLMSRIGGFMSDWGGTVGGAAAGAFGAAGSMAGQTVDRVDPSAGSDYIKDAGTVGAAAGRVSDRVSAGTETLREVHDADRGGNNLLKWLLPLLLLLVLLALGFWFCGPSTTTTNTNTNRAANVNTSNRTANTAAPATGISEPSFSLRAENGKYTVSGSVPDEATRQRIVESLTAQYGAANVSFDGLRIDPSARAFPADWWTNLTAMLPNMKDWKSGSLAFAGGAITEASGLPDAAMGQLRTLFGGWKMPVSIAGAETAAKQANEEAARQLESADSIDEVVKALNLSIINFASGSSQIPGDAQPIIEKAAEVIKKQSAGTSIEIGGHTDSDGDDAANLKLSEARANAVRQALISRGVDAAMLTARGYGETAPVAANDTPDNKFKNRRIEYKTGAGGTPTANTAARTVNSNTVSGNTR